MSCINKSINLLLYHCESLPVNNFRVIMIRVQFQSSQKMKRTNMLWEFRNHSYRFIASFITTLGAYQLCDKFMSKIFAAYEGVQSDVRCAPLHPQPGLNIELSPNCILLIYMFASSYIVGSKATDDCTRREKSAIEDASLHLKFRKWLQTLRRSFLHQLSEGF